MNQERRNAEFLRRAAAVLLAVTIGVASVALSAQPASAHRHKSLSAKVLTAEAFCEELTYPYCSVGGKVKVKNKRAKGTQKLLICLGINVHTADHRSLSVEPLLPDGQAMAQVKPKTSKTITYRTVYDDASGEADHVHVVHVHKHVYHNGGKQC